MNTKEGNKDDLENLQRGAGGGGGAARADAPPAVEPVAEETGRAGGRLLERVRGAGFRPRGARGGAGEDGRGARAAARAVLTLPQLSK